MRDVQPKVKTDVRRLSAEASVIDIEGELTGSADDALLAAFGEASSSPVRKVILNFEKLDYMNSSGIGLLVTVLIRARRQGQRLLAYGLSDHYREIFDLTRLNEAIAICRGEAEALAAAPAA